jgi:hypothetical protein
LVAAVGRGALRASVAAAAGALATALATAVAGGGKVGTRYAGDGTSNWPSGALGGVSGDTDSGCARAAAATGCDGGITGGAAAHRGA